MLERLGIISDEVSSDLCEALDWVEKQGLKHVEIRMVDGKNIMQLQDDEVKRVRREVDKRGLFVSVLTSPLFKCALDPSRPVETGDQFGQEEEDAETHLKNVGRAMEIADILGTNAIRVFSFWREAEPDKYIDDIAEYLRAAVRIAEQNGKTLLLENEYACNTRYADFLARLAEKLPSKHLKILWDPWNEDYAGRTSFPEGYNLVNSRTAHVHFKYRYLALGPEPFLSQIQALEKDGYEGLFALETHFIPEGGTRMDGSASALDMIKTYLAQGKS